MSSPDLVEPMSPDTLYLKINLAPFQKPFTHPFDFGKDYHARQGIPKYSNREHIIRRLSANIRDQRGWVERTTDRESVQALLDESNNSGSPAAGVLQPPRELTDDEITFLFEELVIYKNYVLELRGRGVLIEPCIDGVWKQDGLLGEKLRHKLIKAVSILEKVTSKERDWPDLPDIPLKDLLDPCMYPIVYDETLSISKDDGSFKPVSPPVLIPPRAEFGGLYPVNFEKQGLDTFFAWLPSEFEVSADGTGTKITSYINNLTLPDQDALFHPILGEAFTKMLQAFDHVLSDLDRSVYHWKKEDGAGFVRKWVPPSIQPERSLEGRDLKVVVRLVQIDLDPKKLRYMYAGGSWHMEGMANERIVATGIYQYFQDNVTDWYIHFRMKSYYPDNNIHSRMDAGATEYLGSMKVLENRAIAYPNMFESRISEFGLKDKTKPGSVKLLLFHICDPFGHHIPSTKTILPQQPHYETSLRLTRLGRLPEEIFQQITKDIWGNVITEEEAKEYRELMLDNRAGLLESGLDSCGLENFWR